MNTTCVGRKCVEVFWEVCVFSVQPAFCSVRLNGPTAGLARTTRLPIFKGGIKPSAFTQQSVTNPWGGPRCLPSFSVISARVYFNSPPENLCFRLFGQCEIEPGLIPLWKSLKGRPSATKALSA